MPELISQSQYIYHLSLMIALGAATLILPRGEGNRNLVAIMHGLLFGSVAVIGMLNPITATPGIIFDGRSVLISLCSLYFGPLAGLIAAGMASICRIYQGGIGVLPGLLVIAISLGVGLHFHRRQAHPKDEWTATQLFGIGLIVHIGMIAALFLTLFRISLDELLAILREATLPILILYPMATVLLGKALSIQATQLRLLRAAKAGETRLHEVIDHAPVALALSNEEGNITYLNHRHFQLFGYTREEIATTADWLRQAYPDAQYREEVIARWNAALARATLDNGRVVAEEYRVTSKQGLDLYVEISAVTLGKDLLVSFNDVTARRRSENYSESLRRLFAMLSQTNKLITRQLDTNALLEGVCNIAVERGRFQFAWYGAPNDDGAVVPMARAGDDKGYIDTVDISIREDHPHGHGPTAQAIRTGKTVVTNDFLAASATTPWHHLARTLGIASSGVFPVTQLGTVVGAYNLYSEEVGFFTPEKVATIEEMVADLSYALDAKLRDQQREQAIAEVQSLSERLNHYLQVSPVIGYYLQIEQSSVTSVWVSENIVDLLGYTVEEALEDGWWEAHLHPEDRDRAVANANSIREKGQVNHEYRFFRKDGSILWVLDALKLETQGSDTAFRVVGAWTDITQLRLNEENLHLQSSALNATANAIVITDIKGNIEWINPAFTAITQYTADEVLGRNPGTIIKSGLHDDDYYKNLWETILAGKVWRGLLKNRRKDGTIYTEEQTITPIRNAAGIITHFVGIKIDVTEQVRIQSALSESEHRLKRALHIGNIALWEWDLATDEVDYSSEWSDHVGKPDFGVTRTLDEWFEHVHPADLLLLKRDLMLQHMPTPPIIHRDFRLKHRDDDYRWIRMNASLEVDEAGKIARILGTNVDVTEIKRLETEFEQAQKLESIGRLAGGVAHDFNNLLSVISGYTEMVLAEMDEESAPHKDLMQVKRAAERAAGLTRQLLAFSRRQLLAPEVLNLNTVVAEAEKMLRRLIGEDILLEVSLDSELGQVMADPGQVEQVLLNLAVNARDAMPHGGCLNICTSNINIDHQEDATGRSVPPGSYVRMHISDNGAGMEEHVLKNLFEPFFTTKEKGKGTGLGLATVYGIVKQSGGYIIVESKPGAGTTFDIYLPRIEMSALEVHPPAQPEITTGNETILLVEDEEELRELARRVLEISGYNVIGAASGADALKIVKDGGPTIHLLITDVIMPGMSGPELALRLAESHPEIKVVYISGYTDDLLARHGVLREGIHLVTKPFTARQLNAQVREALHASPK